MKIAAIISDMDGLLIDSEHMGWLCWREVLLRLGYSLTYDEFLTTLGKGRREFVKWLIDRHGPDFPADESLRLRVEIGDAYIAENGVPKKTGVDALFSLVEQRQIPFGLATSTFREESEKRLRAAGIPLSIFRATICGDEVERTKPAPDLYLRAAEMLGVSPEEVVVLEDSGTGMRAGIAARMNVIGVPDLLPVPEELRESLFYSASNLEEVVRFLEERL